MRPSEVCVQLMPLLHSVNQCFRPAALHVSFSHCTVCRWRHLRTIVLSDCSDRCRCPLRCGLLVLCGAVLPPWVSTDLNRGGRLARRKCTCCMGPPAPSSSCRGRVEAASSHDLTRRSALVIYLDNRPTTPHFCCADKASILHEARPLAWEF